MTALDDVSFTVGVGQAVALLGRNGAGKSSLLRVLAGRDRLDRGRASVLGHDVSRSFPQVAHRLGALVDQPGFLPGLSGQVNLEIVARRHGLGGAPVHEALDRCGLDPAARRRVVSGYSLGMRQRLGLAAALLGAPPVLLLDEPTNGLDPAGIAWVRDLVRSHVAAGGTVLLASHLLGEVEATCERVIVLRAGTVVHDADMASIVRTVSVPVRLRIDGDLHVAVRALGRAGIEVRDQRGGDLHLRPDADQLAKVSRVLAQVDIGVIGLEPTTNPLEVLLGTEGET